MVTNFSFQKNGLSVSFRDLSTGVPDGSTYHWDFGDFKGSEERNITHEYESSGFYIVTLKITAPAVGEEEPQVGEKQLRLGISDMSKTQLSDSIYNLINSYIPESLLPYLSDIDKQAYIEKWQLYIQPLVNHCIPLDKYNDELMYEALENQLIMELAAWDYLNVKLLNLLMSTGEYLSQLTSTKEQAGDGSSKPELTRGDRIKQITTGPTEVQYYDMLSDSTSSLWKTFSQALQPGGVIDELKQRLCMLATRLEIYLPF